MKYFLTILFFLFLITSAQAAPLVCVTEQDGNPDNVCVYKLKFANGDVTNNNDGTASIADSGGGGAAWGSITGTITDQTDLFNALAWQDGGTNVYTSTTTDNVGIGTTTPSGTLEIIKVTSVNPFMISSVPTGDGDYMSVTTAGNVGIGSVGPTASLCVGSTCQFAVSSAGTISGVAGITNTSGYTYASGGTTGTLVNMTANSLTSGVIFSGSSSNNTFTGRLLNLGYSGTGTGTTALIQSTNASATGNVVQIANAGTGNSLLVDDVATDSTPFTVNSAGNVGIGTTSGTAQLDIRFQTPTDPFHIGNSATDTTGAFMLVNSGGLVGIGTNSPNGGLVVMNGNVGIGTWLPSARLQVITAGGDVTTATGGGNVGIGTTVPKNTLQVNGTFQVDNSNSIGWTFIDPTDNIACNTSCVSGCVFGIADASGVAVTNIVNCSDATADSCLCAGPS